jgi:hypothetical protein
MADIRDEVIKSLNKTNEEIEAITKINETIEKGFIKKRVEEPKEKHETIEADRRTLLKLYHSNTQTHAGYLIAIIIGFLTLISKWKDFVKTDFTSIQFALTTIIFYGFVGLLLGLGVFTVSRIYYWTSFANTAYYVTAENIEDYNSRHQENHIFTCIAGFNGYIYENLTANRKELTRYTQFGLIVKEKSALFVSIISLSSFVLLLALNYLL